MDNTIYGEYNNFRNGSYTYRFASVTSKAIGNRQM